MSSIILMRLRKNVGYVAEPVRQDTGATPTVRAVASRRTYNGRSLEASIVETGDPIEKAH
jgi:hypothetical protein